MLTEHIRQLGYNIDTADLHGHPTQVEGTDPEGRPFYFRVRGLRALYLRGDRYERYNTAFSAPQVLLDVSASWLSTAGVADDLSDPSSWEPIFDLLVAVADEMEDDRRRVQFVI